MRQSLRSANSNLFREYIGAESNSIKFTDVPINPGVEFHFILSFVIDYTTNENSPSPTNGKFNVFWETGHLGPGGPGEVASIKDTTPMSRIIKMYHIDGIDVDYDHFKPDPNTFAECIGRLIVALKKSGTISFASIAPYDDGPIQSHYIFTLRCGGKMAMQ
ncbi:hypothetical protein IFM89_002084 [Coptis chinensis]|uniref:Chitinase n=1 Tax=Coptis chinensis TaxID=261450 RepID=A0A835LGP3_9MAGN|nr:hypothetical protein IFM89_002084 [Coptis chinensis]